MLKKKSFGISFVFQDVRADEEAAQVPLLPRRDVDVHQLSGQLDAADHALSLSEKLGGLHHQTAGLPVRPGRRLPVLVRLLAAERKWRAANKP